MVEPRKVAPRADHGSPRTPAETGLVVPDRPRPDRRRRRRAPDRRATDSTRAPVRARRQWRRRLCGGRRHLPIRHPDGSAVAPDHRPGVRLRGNVLPGWHPARVRAHPGRPRRRPGPALVHPGRRDRRLGHQGADGTGRRQLLVRLVPGWEPDRLYDPTAERLWAAQRPRCRDRHIDRPRRRLVRPMRRHRVASPGRPRDRLPRRRRRAACGARRPARTGPGSARSTRRSRSATATAAHRCHRMARR